eukprot:GGOE01018211.1.p1 GENE.GGOE01018211.1~~GGOE01018211.1.p1  ORF type:complete len:375 (-),score=67.21 GGOE01018211.1:249-1373(-)
MQDALAAAAPDYAAPYDPKVARVQAEAAQVDVSEKVIKYFYDVRTDTWSQATSSVIIDPTPFQEGTMRAAFHLIDLSKPEGQQHYVCKMSKDPREDTAIYFVDVEMQALAKLFADEFNKLNPPKKVDFVEASLIKCLERRSQPILAVEPFLYGKYVKHSNNFGFVSEEDRNTPQAFSHFSYCKSKGDLLICDIQGVQDKYTDPQIHSKDGKGFGKGNMGVEGMLKFFQTHRCNSICRALNLPPHQPKLVDYGTVGYDQLQAGRFMSGQQAKMVQLHPFDRPGKHFPMEHRSSGSGLLSPEQEARIRLAFVEVDVDRDGLIDSSEFLRLCAKLGYKLTLQQARDKMAALSSRGTDRMQYLEFVQWWASGRHEAGW